MPAPIFRSSAKSTVDGGSSVSVNKPTGVVLNDALYAFIALTSSDSTLTPPSGWAEVITGTAMSAGSQNSLTVASPYVKVYAKRATSSEPASYTWGISSGIPDIAAAILAYFDATSLTDGAATSADSTSPHAVPVLGSRLAPGVQLHSWSAWVDSASSLTLVKPSGVTERVLVDAGAGGGVDARLCIVEAPPHGVGHTTPAREFTATSFNAGTASTSNVVSANVMTISIPGPNAAYVPAVML